jgi:putative ABC transport system permease protein
VTLHRAGRRRFFMVDGDAASASAAVAAGTGVLVNRSFARRFGRRPGDWLTLATPTGPLAVRIAGIHLDLTPGDLGIVRLDRELYRRWWRDDGATAIEVSLHRPEDGARVIDAIRARWGASHGLVVLTLGDVRAEYGALLGRLAVLVYPLVAVALMTAAVGTLAGRATSMIARRRATAVLRAVGMTRGQLARLFAMETAAIASLAAGAAVVVGAALGRLQVAILLEGMLGMTIVHAYPHGIAWAGGAALVAASGATGWIFGHRTGRVTPCAALRWD